MFSLFSAENSRVCILTSRALPRAVPLPAPAGGTRPRHPKMTQPAMQTEGGKAFRDILAAGTPVVFDGGMGTSLYEQVCMCSKT